MKVIIVLLTFIPYTLVFASGWYCEEVASSWMQKGTILQSCGIGYGKDENLARLDAYANARKEFDNICNEHTACSNKIVNVDPQRTSCTKNKDGFICHRLFYFYIANKNREIASNPVKLNRGPIIHNTNHVTVHQHQHYQTIQKTVSILKKNKKYRTFIRSVKGVSIYSTNSRRYQGIHLTNPSESEINRAIKRGSSSGGMPRVYIHRN